MLFETYSHQNGFWAITKIDQTEADLFQQLAPFQDISELSRLSFPKRRLEWLTARALAAQLAQKLGLCVQNIAKNDQNCPFLEGSDWKISISHKNDWCAVFLHPYSPIGIDIEELHERLEKTAPRILSADELYLAANLEKLAFFWAAKEAIYKLYGKKGLDFNQNIHIIKKEELYFGKIVLPDFSLEMRLEKILYQNYVIAFCVAT